MLKSCISKSCGACHCHARFRKSKTFNNKTYLISDIMVIAVLDSDGRPKKPAGKKIRSFTKEG